MLTKRLVYRNEPKEKINRWKMRKGDDVINDDKDQAFFLFSCFDFMDTETMLGCDLVRPEPN